MLEELLKYIGIDPEKAKEIKDFKAEFDKTYLRRDVLEDQASPVFKEFQKKAQGAIAGSTISKTRAFLKQNEIEDLSEDEMKDKGVEQVVELALSKTKTKLQKKIADLEEQGKKGGDEKLKALQADLEKVNLKIKDYESLLEVSTKKNEELVQGFAQKEKTWKLDSKHDDLIKRAKFNAQADEYKRAGVLAKFNEIYKLDLDEKGEYAAYDKKTGSMIPNGAAHGKFFTPEELLNDFIEKAGAGVSMKHEKQQQQKQFSTEVANNQQSRTFTPETPGARVRRVSSTIPNAGT